MEAEHGHGDDSDEGPAGGPGEERGDVQGLPVREALALPGSGDAPAALCHARHLGGPQGEQVKESPAVRLAGGLGGAYPTTPNDPAVLSHQGVPLPWKQNSNYFGT